MFADQGNALDTATSLKEKLPDYERMEGRMQPKVLIKI